MSWQSQTIIIAKEFSGLRLDVFLAKAKIAPARSQALRLIAEKRALLNGSLAKASRRLKAGDVLKINLPPLKEEEKLSPFSLPLDIIFEDEDILIVNKPAGLVTHPAPGHKDKTLVNILFHQKKLSPGSQPFRPGIVHRLDKDVSGLMVLTKTKAAQDYMIQSFKERKIKREYWGLSLRAPRWAEGRIETWIKRHPQNRKKFISLPGFQTGAKKAISLYKLIQKHECGISWLKLKLETGRTHQIRVHLSSLACPLAGDRLYGGRKLSSIPDPIRAEAQNLGRTALHARGLSFAHPASGKRLSFKSPWPSDLKPLLAALGFKES